MNNRINHDRTEQNGTIFSRKIRNGVTIFMLTGFVVLYLFRDIHRDVGELTNINSSALYATPFDAIWYPLIGSIIAVGLCLIGIASIRRHSRK